MRDDSELVANCLAGQRAAFDALVERHHRAIYTMLCRLLGNTEDAFDLTQDTFVRAYNKLHTFRLEQSFVAWVRTIATNLCIDHLRRRKQPPISLDERTASGQEPADESPAASPAGQYEASEEARRVLAAVQQLPEKQRAVLVLRHVEGLKLEEIAAALRMPLGTVKTMLFRGREAVRQLVGEL